jgi:PAS domain S-box-containing protein
MTAAPAPDAELALRQQISELKERVSELTHALLTHESFRITDEVLSQVPDAVLMISLDGIILRWLGGAEHIFGYSAEEAVGRPITFFHHPDIRDGLLSRVAQQIGDTGAFYAEMPCQRKDGKAIWIETMAKPVKDSSGKPLFLISVKRDMTRRKQMQEAIERSQAQLAEAQQMAKLGSWEWDIESDRITWSEELYRIYGIKREEFPGTYGSYMQLVHPDDRDRHRAGVKRAFEERRSFAYDHRIVRPDGEVRTLHARGDVIVSSSGRPVRMVGTGQDVTEWKRAEEEIRRLNTELEKRVEERTAELRRSNEDLQQFAYVSSHDLQEPLRTITSYTQLLAKRYGGKFDSDADEFIGYIAEGAQRMSTLISDLLAYSRVTNMDDGPLRPVDTGAIVQLTLLNLARAVEESGAVVSVCSLPVCLGDESQLMQLFQNLIGNAIKYRSQAPLRIEVCSEPHGEFWRFMVRDNGIGIDKSYHDRIFGLFKRLHGREVPGTGLGLAICRKVIEKHGGEIWVDSSAGCGASFYFTLQRP